MTGPRPKATRNDVARLAGTSPAVVSYVVNDGPRPVAAETRARVEAAIEQLGYRPNALARSLRGNRTNVIGLLVPDNSNPFFAELARAIEDHAHAAGYAVLLANAVGDDARELRYARTMVEQRVEGLVLSSAGHSSEVVRELTDAQVPMVMVDRQVPGIAAHVLSVDNEGGGRSATRHLIEHGHERIACIAGPGDLAPAADRHRGWSRALIEAGLRDADELLVRSEFNRAGGYAAAKELLARPKRPTALFACTDQQAIGALRAIAEAGLSVPGDVAVVGFDGIAEGTYTNPPLATVRQPIRQLGERAVELLLENLRGGAPLREQDEVMPVVLAPNASCGCTGRAEEE